MYSTKIEAENKACCGPENCGARRMDPMKQPDPTRYCITTDCMGWVWGDTSWGDMELPKDKWKGHCGLTGA